MDQSKPAKKYPYKEKPTKDMPQSKTDGSRNTNSVKDNTSTKMNPEPILKKGVSMKYPSPNKSTIKVVDKAGQMTEQIVIDSDDEEVPINASNENKEEGDSIEGNEVHVIAKTEYDHKQGHVQGRAPTGGRGHSGVDNFKH